MSKNDLYVPKNSRQSSLNEIIDSRIATSGAGTVFINAVQTLTNKTLTSPIINTGIFNAGSAASPSVQVGTGAGIYSNATNELNFSTGGAVRLSIGTGFINVNAAGIRHAGGSAANCAFQLNGSNTGLYLVSGNPSFAVAGNNIATISSTGLSITGGLTVSTSLTVSGSLTVGGGGTPISRVFEGGLTFGSPNLSPAFGSFATQTITFPQAFSTTPRVYLSVANVNTGAAINCLVATAQNVTTTSFDLVVGNAHPSVTTTGNIRIVWRASDGS